MSPFVEVPRWIVLVPGSLHGLFYGDATVWDAVAYIRRTSIEKWAIEYRSPGNPDGKWKWLRYVETWQIARTEVNGLDLKRPE